MVLGHLDERIFTPLRATERFYVKLYIFLKYKVRYQLRNNQSQVSIFADKVNNKFCE